MLCRTFRQWPISCRATSRTCGSASVRRPAPDIVDKLNREINAGLADPKLKARYAELGSAVFPTTPGDLGKLFVTDTEKWAKVVKFSGAKPE